MELSRVTVSLRAFPGSARSYEALFVVNNQAANTMAPSKELRRIGVVERGRTAYEMADKTVQEYSFGLVEIAFMGGVAAGRVIFGPDDAEPLLGVTALESVGITVDPTNLALRRLPAVALK